MILENGEELKSVEEVHEGAISFLKDLLSVSPTSLDDNDLDLISPIISQEEIISLCKMPNLEEVRLALWSIPGDSSPGPDGFSASFFIHAWDIGKDDHLNVSIEFFGGFPFITALCATNIVLIPKTEDPNSFTKFWPIILCSCLYKIISKIMVSRMAPLIEGMISREQSAFLHGQSIFYNISIAREMVHGLHKKIRDGKPATLG